MRQSVEVRKGALNETRVIDSPHSLLEEGEVRLRVESFSVTANNITYAVIGDMFRYWDFFPASSDDWGIVPMWGHAVVEETRCADLSIGERVYGYLPMATHLTVVLAKVSASGFADSATHRLPMAAIYNQYSRLAADPEHDPAYVDQRMVFGPLFKTGFLIETFMRREGWFGAEDCVMTSASSKTAMALAHCVKASSPGIKRIGLTSAANLAFVRETGLYDQVLSYDDLGALAKVPIVSVDFAGNASVLRAVHEELGSVLKYSSTVGATHVAARSGDGSSTPLTGPTPTLFFAPTEAAATIQALGPQGFAEAVGASWRGFLSVMSDHVTIDTRFGMAAAAEAFLDTLAGKVHPATGIVIHP
jgi:Protein of unknown function (DUF2855)